MDKRAATGFGLRAFIISMLVAFVTACGGGGGGGDPVVVSIVVTPANSSLGQGLTQNYVATARMSSGPDKVITAEPGIAWSSTSPAVASISGAGVATGVSNGNTTIRATFDGVTGTTGLTVVPGLKEIEVNPPAPSVAKGLTLDLTADAVPLTGTTTTDITRTATWTSLTPAVATVGNLGASKGRVTGVSVGTAQIQVSANGVQEVVTVTVTAATISSVAITPPTATVPDGATQQYTVTATLSDGSTSNISNSTQTTWSVVNVPAPPAGGAPAVASISNVTATKGLATAESAGTAKVTAKVTGFPDLNAELVVNAAEFREIQIDPASPSIPRGVTQQLTATSILSDGTRTVITNTAVWSSSDDSIATVSDTGEVTAIEKGTVTIRAREAGTARIGSATVTVGDASLTSIEIEPGPTVSLPRGGYSLQFIATGVFSDSTTRDLTKQALWISSVPGNASISNAAATKGLATSNPTATGLTNITAKLGTVTSALSALTVTDETLTGISVTPGAASVGLGNTQQFTATASFSGASEGRDITQRVTWTSGDESIATVSNAAGSKGLVTTQSISATPVNITATFGGQSGVGRLTVSAATLVSIEVTPSEAILPKSFTRPLQAIGTYSDGTVEDVTEDVTWVSSRSATATVSNATGTEGVVRGGTAGNAVITAGISVNGTAVFDTSDITVTDAVLESIAVTPAAITLPLGVDQVFKASGTFSDDFVMDISSQVTWSSSDPNVASISATSGLATTNAVGGAIDIVATKGTAAGTTPPLTGKARLTVLLASVESIRIRPDTQTCASPVLADDTVFLPRPFTAGLIACATYSDAVVRNVTSQVEWTSSNTDVVTVGNGSTNKGIVSPVTDTRGVVNAALGGKVDSIVVEVTNDTLAGIVVTPADQSIFNNSAPIQFVATGSFSNPATPGVTRTLGITRHVTWSAEDDTVSISNAAGSQGLASPGRSPLAAHNVEIKATRGSINDTEIVNRRANAPAAP